MKVKYFMYLCILFTSCDSQPSNRGKTASIEQTITKHSAKFVGLSIDRVYGGSESKPDIFIALQDSVKKSVTIYQLKESYKKEGQELEKRQSISIPTGNNFICFSIDRVYGDDEGIIFITLQDQQSKKFTSYKVTKSGEFENPLGIK